MFTRSLGKWSNLTNMFQMGWNLKPPRSSEMVDIALTYTRGFSTYWPISNTVKAIGIGGPASLLLPTKMTAFLAAGRRGGRTQLSTGGRDVVIPTKCLYSNTWLKDERPTSACTVHGGERRGACADGGETRGACALPCWGESTWFTCQGCLATSWLMCPSYPSPTRSLTTHLLDFWRGIPWIIKIKPCKLT